MRGWKLRGFGVNSAPQRTLSPPPPRTLSEFFAERAAFPYGRPLSEPNRRLPKATPFLSMSSMTSNDPLMRPSPWPTKLQKRASRRNLRKARKRRAEQDPFDADDEPLERLPPRLDRTQAQILAFEAHQVEGHQRGLRAAIRSPWLSLGSVGEGASASATS